VLRVVVLDVGQGDATVAILPDGRTVLVDTGGLAGTTFDIAGRVVLPSLRALGVRQLHALTITHPDPDHIGGAETIVRRLDTAYIWEGVPVPPHPARRALMDLAMARRIPWRTLRPSDTELLAGVEIKVHHPPQPEWERQRVRNDDSVVLEFRYHDVSILLPGDIGREVEALLAPGLRLAPLTVLKAAHHGSATSSSEVFIDAVNPAAVIFSTGKNNVFRHPAAVVVQRYAQRAIPAFNTAEDGAVFVETDGKSIEVYGWKTGRRLRIERQVRDAER
jgi:competence protein ComEC